MRQMVCSILAVLLISATTVLAAEADEHAPISVTTWHYDHFHTGQDLSEIVLTPRNVNATSFGKLFTQPIDGYAFAQPLYVPSVRINVPGGKNNGVHNVVFVATEHDSVYAFDADSGEGANANPLWKVSFIDQANGISTIPANDVHSHDLVPEIGITGTPVIDLSSNTLFVMAKTKELRLIDKVKSIHYVQRLHALDLASGAEKLGAPVVVGDCHYIDFTSGRYENTSILQYPGRGTPHDTIRDGRVVFNAFLQNQRASLMLLNGMVFVSWGSHADKQPSHGWMAAFSTKDLSLQGVLNTSPDGGLDTIWMGGSSPAVDRDGSILVSLGNGNFDVHLGGRDYGECVVKIVFNSAGENPWDRLVISDYFCPADFDKLNERDNDLGSGGPLLLPDQAGAHPHELIVCGKEGVVYVLDRDHLGHINNPPRGPDLAVEEIPKNELMRDRGNVTASSINTAAYWNGYVYYTGHQRPLMQIPMSDGFLAHTPLHLGNNAFDFPFPTPQISANGTSDGIVWLQSSGPNGKLYAYDATDVSHELWNSTQAGTRDQYGGTTKFGMPIIANGKVYAAGQTALAAFGILQTNVGALNAPANLAASAITSREIDLAWTAKSDNNDGYRIERSSAGEDFKEIGATGPAVTTFHDLRLAPSKEYAYRVAAYNASGKSDFAGPARATTKSIAVPDGLVGWWTFDEGTGNNASDSSAASTVGEINGEVSWVAGRVGDSSLSFHGAGVAPGFVSVANQANMDFTQSQSFTLAAWIDPANIPNKWCGWITHSTDKGASYGICTNPSNQWVFGTAKNPNNIAGGTLTMGWHHLVVVQDGAANTRTLYVDGKPVAHGPAADASGTGDLWVGGSKDNEEEYVDGSIDDVRIYNRALTEAEIGSLAGWHNPATPVITAQMAGNRIEIRCVEADNDAALLIQRSVAGGDWSDVSLLSLAGTVGHFSDSPDPAKGLAYRYRVRAVNDAGSSPYSNVAQVQTGQ